MTGVSAASRARAHWRRALQLISSARGHALCKKVQLGKEAVSGAAGRSGSSMFQGVVTKPHLQVRTLSPLSPPTILHRVPSPP